MTSVFYSLARETDRGRRFKNCQEYYTYQVYEQFFTNVRNEYGGRSSRLVARKRRFVMHRLFYWTFRCVARSCYQRVNVAMIIWLMRRTPYSHVSMSLVAFEKCIKQERFVILFYYEIPNINAYSTLYQCVCNLKLDACKLICFDKKQRNIRYI